MYNEDEINDSLEFCRDIEVFYKKKSQRNAYQNYMKKKSYSNLYSGKVLTDTTKSSYFDNKAEKNKDVEDIEAVEERKGLLSRIFSNLSGILLIIFLAYGISSFVTNYCIWQTQVDGISMEPALVDGDKLIIDKLSYHFNEPERFDIVVFPQKIDVYYVKRIIGLPGETIQIINGKIYIDGIVLTENYGKEPIDENYSMELPVTLGENQYFVLGDNRNYSVDSRDSSVGTVSKNYIIGKAWIIMAPKERVQVFK